MVNISLEQELTNLSVKDTRPCAGLGQDIKAGSFCYTSQLYQDCPTVLEPCWISVLAARGVCRTSWRLGWSISASSCEMPFAAWSAWRPF